MRVSHGLTAALFAATLFASPASGQFGLRGGVNLTRFISDDPADVESTQGLNFGASFRLFSIGPVSIVPELFYSQKGAKVSETGATGPVQLDFSLDYLEVPILARLNLPAVSRLQPYVAAGPAFAWQLNCEMDVTGGDPGAGIRDCGEQFGDVDTAFQDADRGLVVTGGVELPVLGSGGLNLEARLVRGLARLQETEAGGEGEFKNQTVSLMLGYSFGL